MFVKVLAFFALVAVALANPKPEPQFLAAAPVTAYSAGGPITYSGYAASPYAAPFAASPYSAVPYPLAYTGGYYF